MAKISHHPCLDAHYSTAYNIIVALCNKTVLRSLLFSFRGVVEVLPDLFRGMGAWRTFEVLLLIWLLQNQI